MPAQIKILPSNKILEAWNYNYMSHHGQAIGLKDEEEPLIQVESVVKDGTTLYQIVINKTVAEKHGFEIKIN